MLRFKEFLLEGKQRGDLHHYTSAKYAIDILNDNRLGLDFPSENVSLTRNKNFHKQSRATAIDRSKNNRLGGPTDVSFVLDGDKITDNYKVNPKNDFPLKPHKGVHDEQEEEVQGTLKNVKKYIKSIRIHNPKIDPKHREQIESHGIPIENIY